VPIAHRLCSCIVVAATLTAGTAVHAQDAPAIPASLLLEAWTRAAASTSPELTTAGTPDARVAAYEEIIRRMLSDPEIASRRDTASYRQALEALAAEVPDATLAKSVNGGLSNPASGSLLERSGFTDIIALATDFKQALSADRSAISVNLNALALVGGGRNGAYSAPYRYRQHGLLRRFGGTVTFGASVPEGAITGFTGLPDADRLLDVFVWDVKVRVAGDRDPRAARWYPLLLGEMGDATEIAGRVTGLPVIPDQDVALVAEAANRVLGARLADAQRAIGSSLQASVKVSGQHLTQESGRNKFTVAGMVDKGFGAFDLTANVSYSATDEMRMEATDPFRAREWRVGAGITGSVLRDVVSPGRSAEIDASLTGTFPVDTGDVPIDRKRVWKTGVTLALPFQRSAKIPISITYSNDPNNLAKQKFVTGHIGISYDFGSLFRSLGGTTPGT
jgi:hypothetical protein